MNETTTRNDAIPTSNRQFISGVVEGFYGRPWSCEQRRDLFDRLREFKLNSYMYAPKDDLKHRAKWRQPYNEQEADELRSLIEVARLNGINFYYSLAPGLDMVYSDPEELSLLRRKYDQLVGLGCESFAILFDDIEPRLCDKDKEAFADYPSAQISVANMIFEHLKRPKFLFCPTEYCESRAVPNVPGSVYLNAIGSGLLEGIDIMWSGPRVVSRLITEESIETLTKVIKRPPVIWENLHANDYDKKRVFLGPYSGRSTKIIPKLRGVLTNPNCEYEANYVAMHTLAQWTRSSADVNLHNRSDVAETTSVEDQQEPASRVYDPHRALKLALKDWLPHFFKATSIPNGLNLVVSRRHDNDEAIGQLTKEASSQSDKCKEEPVVDMSPGGTPSSTSSTGTGKSNMDTSSPADNNSCESCEMQVVADQPTSKKPSKTDMNGVQSQSNSAEDTPPDYEMSTGDRSENIAPPQPTEPSSQPQKEGCFKANAESLSLLVDLFYLPFHHGAHGRALLDDFRWLRNNHESLIYSQPHQPHTQPQKSESDLTTTTTTSALGVNKSEPASESQGDKELSSADWIAKADKMDELCARIGDLVNNLISNCPNKLLMLELYPYLADMRLISDKIRDYLRDLRSGYRVNHRPDTAREQTGSLKRASGGGAPKEPMICEDEQEPWVHRGGLNSDVQRLISD